MSRAARYLFWVMLWVPASFALATECSSIGAAPTIPPNDSNDGGATACGDSSYAAGNDSSAYGNLALSQGYRSTAIGYAAYAVGSGSTAVGEGSSTGGTGDTAVGYSAAASGGASSALGYDTTASALDSTAVGRAASATGSSSTALGSIATSASYASTALGYQAKALAQHSTALGMRAYTEQPNAIVIGAVPGVNFGPAYANVGMGTTSPTEALDVERSEAAARLQLTSFTNDAVQAPQYIQRRARGTRNSPAAVQANDNLGLFSFRGYNGSVLGGSRATITAQAAGNFTANSTPTRIIFSTTPIGKTVPEPVLTITPDGKVQVKGTNLNVPDYVFENDYDLMPLEELRAFIDANGHLPGIPSVEQVNAEGHDLAGSDMAHLRKIEELTLYTLEQEKRIGQLEKQVAMLMQAMSNPE